MPILNGIYADTPFDTKEILQADLNIANKSRSNPLRWKGQFSPQLVQVFLDKYCDRDTTVFDPFLGSGTVLLESGMAGLKASGTEINPAAAMLAQTYRLINISVDSRRSHLQTVSNLLHDELLPELPFFQNIEQDQSETNFEVLKLKLISLLSKVDDRFQCGLLETLITLLDFYQADISVEKIFKVWENFGKLVVKLPFSYQPIEVFLSDAREAPLSDSSVDLVITSPPYINVFNYHQQYRASMEALNWNLLKVSKSEFGANRKHRGNRFLTVVQFCLDIVQTLSELARVCRSGARLIFVVGRESTVKGTRFFNGEIVTEVCHRSLGFNLILKQQRVFRNSFGQSIFEDILHFSPPIRCPLPEVYLEAARTVAQETLEASYSAVPEKSKKDIKSVLKNIRDVHPSPLFNVKDVKGI
jgi:DNA modification methylase